MIIGYEHGLVHMFSNTTLYFSYFGNKIVELFLYKTYKNTNVFSSRSNYFRFKNRNTTCVAFPMYCWCTSVECQGFHVSPDSLSFLDSFIHASNFSISGVRGYILFNIHFTSDSNTKYSMYNTQHWPSYVKNYGMIRILMKF